MFFFVYFALGNVNTILSRRFEKTKCHTRWRRCHEARQLTHDECETSILQAGRRIFEENQILISAWPILIPFQKFLLMSFIELLEFNCIISGEKFQNICKIRKLGPWIFWWSEKIYSNFEFKKLRNYPQCMLKNIMKKWWKPILRRMNKTNCTEKNRENKFTWKWGKPILRENWEILFYEKNSGKTTPK